MTKPIIWIAAGGTGGHIYPALAVAKTMHAAGWQVHWVGCKDGLEQRLCQQHTVQFWSIPNLKWRGLKSSFQWLKRFMQSINQLRKVRRVVPANVVLCMGGYVTLPTGLMAIMSRTPLFIHEQNAVLGRTNRLLYPFIFSGFCAFPDVAKRYPGLYQVGNPHTFPIQPHKRSFPKKPFKILSFGGSQGAKQLNDLMQQVMQDERLNQCEFWHIAGHQGQAMLAMNSQHIKVETYNDAMEAAYAWADLVIMRCGAMSLTEASAQGLPALLLPYQHAKDDHQRKNADYYIERHAALWSAESGDELVQQILNLIQDASLYEKLAENMYRLAPRASTAELMMQHMDTALMTTSKG